MADTLRDAREALDKAALTLAEAAVTFRLFGKPDAGRAMGIAEDATREAVDKIDAHLARLGSASVEPPQPVAWINFHDCGMPGPAMFFGVKPAADSVRPPVPLYTHAAIPADVVRGLERRLADAMDLPTVAVIARDAIAALKESSRVAERGGKPEEKTND